VAFLDGRVAILGDRRVNLQVQAGGPALEFYPGGQVVLLGRISLNRILCSKDSLQPVLRKSQKYKIQAISNTI